MPKEKAARYRVVKDFDFFPRKNVVQVFRAGEERAGLTKAQIERGESLRALKLIANEEE